jgi:dihydroxy-acid dehydratase
VADLDLAKRALENRGEAPTAARGYRKLFLETVTQADQGVDFDFLRAAQMRGPVPGQE